MECRVNETYPCILGESQDAGLSAWLIRFSGCNLDCSYCDTRYAAYEPGNSVPVDALVEQVVGSGLGRALITGGEPLLQRNAVIELSYALHRHGIEIILETNGTLPLEGIPSFVTKVVDVKTPGSARGSGRLSKAQLGSGRSSLVSEQSDRAPLEGNTPESAPGAWINGERWQSPFLLSNLPLLTPRDQLKFVFTSRDDYLWAVAFISEQIRGRQSAIHNRNVLFSPAWDILSPADLASWMLEDRLPYRFHLQIHKVVWGNSRGV